MKKCSLSMVVAFVLALAAISAGGRGAIAAAALDPLCDAALFDQMVERARLQSQRRTATEENLIYKPDSILEYVCLDRGLEPTAPYVDGNFNHEYLGGRAPAGLAITVDGGICDAMSVVWNVAQCMNFSPGEPEDGYYDLDAFMTAPEIRRYPTACNAPTTVAFGTIPVPATPVAFAPAVSPITPPADCGLPIPTGNTINVSVGPGETRPPVFLEKLCPNPTCTYEPTGINTGNCVP